MILRKTIAKYILKKRTIFIVKNNNKLNYPKSNSKINIKKIDLKKYSISDFIKLIKKIVPDTKLNQYIKKYYQKKWTLFVAYYNNNPAGCTWYIVSEKNYLYDSFAHTQNQINVGSTFINKKYRKHNLQNYLKKEIFSHIFSKYKNKNIIVIVEYLNAPSLKNAYKLNMKIYGTNYLIKFLKYNIISIFITKNKKYLWILPFIKKNSF
jgi:hypothetical protein